MEPWCERSAGVLLHLTSLPGGRLDADMRRFAERIAAAGLRVWQILPTGPSAAGHNPFATSSAFAGDPHLVKSAGAVDRKAYGRFREENADWLEDWALFAALKAAHDGEPWWQWPTALRRRDPSALSRAGLGLADAIEQARVAQFRFESAWTAFHRSVQALGLRLFGDVPLFVSRDSADVWAHRELFESDADGRLESLVGVPPDAFSDSGQLWGLPPYRWEAMAASGYAWWKRRFEVQARRHDLLRLDHFRGFAAWWRIPPEAQTAAEGAWAPGPGPAPIDALAPVLRNVRLIAEDLGVITEDVVALRRALGLPGMRVLQFAFDGNPENPHLPQHHEPDSVCYTGTHDNDTTLGWWLSLSTEQQAAAARALGAGIPEMPRALVELAWSSPAPLAVVPMQDLLGLGTMARMNRPGVGEGNWRWSFRWEQLPRDFEAALHETLDRHGRVS
ncbi:MAG: 4-alpha-glucanotransferase [Steroidobacteraceae bacterium]